MGPNYDKSGTIDIPTSRETLQMTEMGNLAPALYEKLEKLEAKVADLETMHARESRTGGNVIKEGESFQSKNQLRKFQDHENSIDKYFHNNFKNYRQYRVRPTWSMFPNDYMNFLNKEIEALSSYGKVQEDLIHRLLFNILPAQTLSVLRDRYADGKASFDFGTEHIDVILSEVERICHETMMGRN